MYKHKLMKNKLFKNLCVIIVSFKSQTKILKFIKKLDKSISVIIVENSKDIDLKLKIKKKFKNVKVIIPKQNKGIAYSINLAIKKTNKEFIMYLATDIDVKNNQINQLLKKATQIKNFGAITAKIHGQDYKDLIIRKNKTMGLTEVSFNTGCIMLMKKKLIKKVNYFDDNYFLYFEESDFYKRCIDNNLPIFMYERVVIKHEGGAAIERNLISEYKKIRNWHYCWSKFYYYKKHHGYLKGLSKTFPNFLRSLKSIIHGLVTFNFYKVSIHYVEIEGLFSSYLNLKSFYRIKKNKLI
jgi:N-acetylglucosaminyl-diphospho-decaprenol L-rhamnosyltransferase